MTIKTPIDTWYFETATGKNVITGIGTKTATAWTVQIDDSGNVTFEATGLS